MMRHSPSSSRLAASIYVLVGLLSLPTLASESSDAVSKNEPESFAEPAPNPESEGAQPLGARWTQWLMEVDPLISSVERKLFLSLDQDYQREAFQRQFWRVRDPYPRTVRNELKERWPVRMAEAKSQWQTLSDDRSRIFLVHGPPRSAFQVKCTGTRIPGEVWLYDGTDWTDVRLALVFLSRDMGKSEAKLWRPQASGIGSEATLNRLRNCLNGAQLLQVVQFIISNGDEYERQIARLLLKPRPSSLEWIYSFEAYSTDLQSDAELLEAQLDLGYPGRHQHRTVVQGLVELAAADVGTGEYAGYRSHDFRLTGEVIKDDKLFESFRYQFGFPAETAPTNLPLAFQRFLRPGNYRLILKVDDLHSKKEWRRDMRIEVPMSDEAFEAVSYSDPETEELFREVAEAVAAGEDGIRIVPPQDDLLTGFVRFDTLLAGENITKVRFFLDDKEVLTKNRPPYSVQIDLGPYPDLHTLRVEGLDRSGNLLAEDDLLVNSGGYRFILDLREPRPDKTYERSLRARAEIEIPEGRSLDRVEFFLNEAKVATLFQEPWVHPVVLPAGGAPGYVRAVAYLTDGNSTEDLAFFNSPDYVDELEIQFVELYTSVVDSQGRPIGGLQKKDFTVLEDDVEQTIGRFERVEDLPIHVAVLIDSSASMVGTLDEVKRAALSFFQQAIGPKDRAAVIPFSTFPRLAVELTSDATALGSGLAGLAPEGQTALYDSIMYALYYFAGVRGQRALLVLSDGHDESSRFNFAQTLDYARRAGVTIYPIGFRLGGDPTARAKLQRLAEETGGTAHFLRDISELAPVYGAIQDELRSQLLITYQSTNTDQNSGFRQIQLDVDRAGAVVKTLSGYYP
ncbi:MAG: VWA domain-containing protein [Thermoanaerobaculia bacterium]|nr:VWA domain-containing protein [Thermoanaerobaculia bacterium]